MAVPQKIVLKSTTTVSLNERFSSLPPLKKVETFRDEARIQRQASIKNRRLAQQMANRPAVQAALKIKQRSVKQRLGGNIKNRLTLGSRGGFRGGFRGAVRGAVRGTVRGRGRGSLNLTGFTRGVNRGRFQRGRISGRGQRSRGFQKTQNFVSQSRQTWTGGKSLRGQARGQRGGRANFRGRRGTRGTSFTRGGRGGRGRGRFQRGRGGRGRGATQFSREDLDNQLDAYMAQTKSGLNNELDAYMAQGN